MDIPDFKGDDECEIIEVKSKNHKKINIFSKDEEKQETVLQGIQPEKFVINLECSDDEL